MTTSTVLYLHGVGGGSSREQWLAPLNRALSALDHSPLDTEHDLIIDPDYQSALDRAGHETAGTTWPISTSR